MKRLALLLLLIPIPLCAQTAPTRSGSSIVADWSTTTSPKTTPASLSWSTGDVICAVSVMEDASGALGLATATGLTFSNLAYVHASNTAPVRVDCATAGSNSSGTVSMTGTGAKRWGMGAVVYTGTDGVGTCTTGAGSGRTVSRTNSAADSAVIWAIGDWGAGTTQTPTPTPTTTDKSSQMSPYYTAYLFDLTDQASAGAVSYGLTGSGGGPYNIAACEVKGAAGGGSSAPPPMSMMLGVGD
jgi:hypothetical protein